MILKRIFMRLRISKMQFVLIVMDMVCMEDIPVLFVTELDKYNLRKWKPVLMVILVLEDVLISMDHVILVVDVKNMCMLQDRLNA